MKKYLYSFLVSLLVLCTIPMSSLAAPIEIKLKPDTSIGPGYYQINKRQLRAAPAVFLSQIKQGALNGWSKYKVLPSITAAQAALESGWGSSQLAAQGNNLFGIKGRYNGQYVVMPTQEYISGQWITVNAEFRKYPNWAASVEDHGAFFHQNSRYANLIGVKDYKSVARLLQQDGYATDPSYASKIISTIEANNLQEWDKVGVSYPYSNLNKYVMLTKSGASFYGNLECTSKKGQTTKDAIYYVQRAYKLPNGKSIYSVYTDSAAKTWLGYLKESDNAARIATMATEINKTVMVNRENKTIDTLPWGQKGYKNVSRSTSYTGKVVTLTQDLGSYAYSPELKGWIDKKGISSVISVNVAGTIQKGGFSIDPMPWYEGIKHSGATKDHIGEKVTVTAKNGSYYYVANLGWIDKKAFNPDLQKKVDAEKSKDVVTKKALPYGEVNKTVMVNQENKTIDTLPWGQKGYKNVSRSTSHTGKVVNITQETYSYAYSPELKGWIDKKGITPVVAVNVAGTIQKGGFSIDPVPWYEGIEHSGATKDHIGEKVTVTAKNGSYYYVANLGWIDKKAFNPELQKQVN